MEDNNNHSILQDKILKIIDNFEATEVDFSLSYTKAFSEAVNMLKEVVFFSLNEQDVGIKYGNEVLTDVGTENTLM
jgi:hypothetical protein